MTPKIGFYTALLSFLIGSLLLILFYLTSSSNIIALGIFFIGIAGIINTGVFIKVIFEILKEKRNKKKYYITAGVMLLNIPIVVLYFYTVLFLMTATRVTFINDTGKEISALKIMGGELKTIEKLSVGEKQSEWFQIKFEDNLLVEYLIDGHLKTDNIGDGYMITGKKINHRMGRNSDNIENTY